MAIMAMLESTAVKNNCRLFAIEMTQRLPIEIREQTMADLKIEQIIEFFIRIAVTVDSAVTQLLRSGCADWRSDRRSDRKLFGSKAGNKWREMSLIVRSFGYNTIGEQRSETISECIIPIKGRAQAQHCHSSGTPLAQRWRVHWVLHRWLSCRLNVSLIECTFYALIKRCERRTAFHVCDGYSSFDRLSGELIKHFALSFSLPFIANVLKIQFNIRWNCIQCFALKIIFRQ